MTKTVRTCLALAALALALSASSAAAQAPFSAHGSVRQVYVTGLTPKASLTLLSARGRKLATKRADAQGGLIFRNVKPGSGYRVRLGRKGAKSDPLTVLSTGSAPPSTDIYN